MKKIAIVCGQDFITYQNDGGKKCCYRNYMMLRHAYGAENVYVCLFMKENREYPDRNIKVLPPHKNIVHKAMGVLGGNFFYGSGTEKLLIEFIKQNNIDIVWFERSLFGNTIKKIAIKYGIPCQVFVHNIETNYFYNKAKHQNILLYLLWPTIKRSEKKTFKYVDDIFCLTKRDQENLQLKYGRQSNEILAMSFEDQYAANRRRISAAYDTGKEKTLLFIGSFFLPNYEGIRWFIDNVMNELQEYTLVVVGKNFENKRKELERENVIVIGTVEDLAFYYFSNSAMVLPIQYGDGQKIKTAEAMMYGKIIFATRETLEGYDVKQVDGIYECNTAEEFRVKIRKEYPTDGKFFSQSVRDCFLEKYESGKLFQKYKEIKR